MNSILRSFGFRPRLREVEYTSHGILPCLDDSSWLVKRPDEEGWGTIIFGDTLGTFANTLGTGKYEYHERTKEFIKWVFGREFHAFDEVHPIVMAPFELASNRPVYTWYGQGIFDNFRDDNNAVNVALTHDMLPFCTASAPLPNEVWNLTAEMALYIDRFTEHDKEQALEYLNSIDVEPHSSGEIIVLFGWLLKQVTNDRFGGFHISPDYFIWNVPLQLRALQSCFNLIRDTEYMELFLSWADKYKIAIFDLLCRQSTLESTLESTLGYRILKIQPDLSNVLIAVPEEAFPGTQVKAVFFHNARGMSLQNLGRSHTTAEKRDNLKYRRGSWVKRSFKGTIAAWVWIVISIGLSWYTAFTNRKNGVLEAIINFLGLFSIMTIGVFGFVKLIVYDDSVLTLTGWEAVNDTKKMKQYLYGLDDEDEAEAEATRDMAEDYIFQNYRVSALRQTTHQGELKLNGLKRAYLGRAYYVDLGNIVIDLITNSVLEVAQYEHGNGSLHNRQPLTLENLTAAIQRSAVGNDSSEGVVIKRKVERYL